MKTNLIGILSCAVMTVLVLCVHISPYTVSMIDYHNAEYNQQHDVISLQYLEEIVHIHRSHPVFSRRPMVTFLIDSLAKICQIETGLSYVVIQFSLMFLSGMALFFLSLKLLRNRSLALLSTVSYFLSFTILFAFFSTNYTYANLLQYLLLFLCLSSFVHGNKLLTALFFGLSLYCHESGIVLIPGLYLIQRHASRLKRLNMITAGLLLYGVLLYLTIGNETQLRVTSAYFKSRVHLSEFNFQDMRYSTESIFSIFLAAGIPTYLLWRNKKMSHIAHKAWVSAFWIGLALSIPLFLFFAKARESRLFPTALVFVWPLMGPFVKQLAIELSTEIKRSFHHSKSRLLAILCIGLGGSFIISYLLYEQTGQLPNSNLHNEFLFLSLTIVSIHFMLTQKNGGINPSEL